MLFTELMKVLHCKRQRDGELTGDVPAEVPHGQLLVGSGCHRLPVKTNKQFTGFLCLNLVQCSVGDEMMYDDDGGGGGPPRQSRHVLWVTLMVLRQSEQLGCY